MRTKHYSRPWYLPGPCAIINKELRRMFSDCAGVGALRLRNNILRAVCALYPARRKKPKGFCGARLQLLAIVLYFLSFSRRHENGTVCCYCAFYMFICAYLCSFVLRTPNRACLHSFASQPTPIRHARKPLVLLGFFIYPLLLV